MKGIIYSHYSSDNQREESIEGQLREYKEYAERNDITNEEIVLEAMLEGYALHSCGKIMLNIMNYLLKNRCYMGEYSYRDVVKEDSIPVIVPKELFERV